MKIAEALFLSRQKLKSAGINSYHLDSLVLLGFCLKLSKEQIIFNPDLILNTKQIADFFDLIERRSLKEPVSHLVSQREFFGNNFFVNSKVLDPRPDSETLIEAVISCFSDQNQKLNILELGVGSGCLILTLLKIFNNALGLGVDVSYDALVIAQKNCNLLNLQKRCEFIKSDWFLELDQNQQFDLIISNPPYIKTIDINFLQEEVKNYEPIIALDGGKDGLICYKKIAANIMNFLKPNAIVALEIGQNQEQEITKIFIDIGLKLVFEKKDLAGIIRCLIFKKNANI